MGIFKSLFDLLLNLFKSIGVPEGLAEFCPGFFLCLLMVISVKLMFRNKSADSGKTKIITAEPKTTSSQGLSQSELSGTRVAARHFARVDLNIKSYFWIKDTTERFKCKITDMSLSGAAFVADETIKKGARITLEIPNPDQTNHVFQVSGEIIRASHNGKKNHDYGIRFFHLMNQQYSLVEKIVNKNK